MSTDTQKQPSWIIKGKTISELIRELQTFEDQDLEVRISVDDEKTYRCISLVKRKQALGGYFCGLVNRESET